MVDVALITSSYLPHVGGVEEHVRNVARHLLRQGLSVVVWTVEHGERSPDVVDGITVRTLPCPLPARTATSVMSFAWRGPLALVRWASALLRDRPRVMHVHCFGPNGVWALGAAQGRRLVITSHGETRGDAHDAFGTSALLRTALRKALRRADAVTGVSASVLDDLHARFALASGRATVIGNGVDLTERAGAMPPALPARYVLGIGRLVHTKGFDLLLRAFARAGLPPDVGIVLAGDGPERASLTALAAAEGVAGRVVFTGRLDRGEIVAVASGALALAVPSRVEAFGIVVLEGWRAGIPVIAGAGEGPAELIRDGVDGIVVDASDSGAFAAVLTQVVADPDGMRALAAAGAARCRAYSWENVAAAYRAVYATLGVRAEVDSISA
ncbi:glycosyltransferase family 4 protein [Microbacterium kribbense]|uniref:D-inositol 3-phosphate glycosyltransferase n=1 Tax=Microbacterium kribbense TaxID=433645 RepID=A0ABP7FZ75_9MICO